MMAAGALSELCVVMVTCSSRTQAKSIVEKIVVERLAACGNIIGGDDPESQILSIYSWKGKIETDGENLIIFKSRTGLVPELAARVKELHSYDVPEVIALPIIAGSKEYMDWVLANTRTPTELKGPTLDL